MSDLTSIIRHRRSVYPEAYSERLIAKEDIEALLENANWAPNHKNTEPWRFRVFHSETARSRLSRFLQQQYDQNTDADAFSPFKHKKIGKKVLQAACVLGLLLQRDPQQRLPEWEEVAAVACAVQNIWLSATAKGIGGYWSTPSFIQQPEEFFQMEAHDQFRGLFYLGYPAGDWPIGKRGPIAEKVKWM